MGKLGKALKKRLEAGETLFGTHVILSDFCVTEMYGNFDFDYIWIETEHSAVDYQELNMHILACQAKGIAAIVRVPFTEPFLAKRVLEMDPDGIIFPMTNTAEMVADAMSYCVYPPNGNRGFGPARANDYGTKNLADYLAEVDDGLCRFVQVEQKEAVDNLDEILEVPYVDGFVVGPMDMSGSIGKLGEMFCPENIEQMSTAVAKIKAKGKAVGTSTGSMDVETLRRFKDLGMQFISAGNDFGFINYGCQMTLDHLKIAFEKED